LLLTCAATISAVSVISISLFSPASIVIIFPLTWIIRRPCQKSFQLFDKLVLNWQNKPRQLVVFTMDDIVDFKDVSPW
jgi:hypothetical protein